MRMNTRKNDSFAGASRPSGAIKIGVNGSREPMNTSLSNALFLLSLKHLCSLPCIIGSMDLTIHWHLLPLFIEGRSPYLSPPE